MDILITIPAKIKWSDYEKELEAVKDCKQVMNFKVPSRPNVKAMDKCYLLHKGFIVGWMNIMGVVSHSFDCTTTKKHYEGIFVQRCGTFNYLEKPVKMKGFQGYRYIDNLKPEIKEQIAQQDH